VRKVFLAIFDDLAVITVLTTIAATFAMLAISCISYLCIGAVAVFGVGGAIWRMFRVYWNLRAREQLGALLLQGRCHDHGSAEFQAWHNQVIEVLTKNMGAEYVARFQSHDPGSQVWAIEEFLKELR
jgi:hypothetical protein